MTSTAGVGACPKVSVGNIERHNDWQSGVTLEFGENCQSIFGRIEEKSREGSRLCYGTYREGLTTIHFEV